MPKKQQNKETISDEELAEILEDTEVIPDTELEPNVTSTDEIIVESTDDFIVEGEMAVTEIPEGEGDYWIRCDILGKSFIIEGEQAEQELKKLRPLLPVGGQIVVQRLL